MTRAACHLKVDGAATRHGLRIDTAMHREDAARRDRNSADCPSAHQRGAIKLSIAEIIVVPIMSNSYAIIDPVNPIAERWSLVKPDDCLAKS